ncbi:MAG TPA: ribonuclease HI [Candidatus Paceibacterota bacterium]|nr:ribonuclease HI [Candidatus Paceibacterota bacterium]
MSIAIYTDGSSRGNPGPGGWAAIIRDQASVFELGGREDHTTNNRMELMAAIQALRAVRTHKLSGPILLQSDSKYVIQGITTWVQGWQKNGWMTRGKKEVGNRDLWEALSAAASGLDIEWRYVEGHAGHPGNERCDEVATAFADRAAVDLYAGPRGRYPVDLDAAPTPGAAAKKKRSSSVPAYSYLSYVDGVLEKHKAWKDCEARVKGVKGAKFKKATSADDEGEIIRSWIGK